MALPATAITPAPREILLFRSLSCQLRIPVVRSVLYRPVSATSCSRGSPRMQLLSDSPNDPLKIKINWDYAAKKIHEVIPDSIQNFPWSEAESVATKRVLSLLQETWKWSLAALFVLGFLSDIAYAISRNKELFIPFGLLCGCVVSEFLKEAYQELLQRSQERSKTWHFLGTASLFALIRIVAVSSALPQPFLLFAANGGFMHILWQLKNFLRAAVRQM
ncbi:OLC1v1017068C1 [Oldenlandia corymbosa var. corymbosa]|uniref:OLC1v1017068C1 n=1 Tax=Oldenlandia corymbosa var. corymbosa TaxID=529605 RepID=A0AAV1E8J4_OLDCO|nr:OLC1v1017068C1 [Oldenlandia corymbosa var. corymbosa]